MMRVSRYNYGAQFPAGVDDLVQRFRTVLLRGDYVPSVDGKRFEEAFARFNGVAHARAVGSGTDALILTMRALGIGTGDEVITQANTFHATVAAIVAVGATPVLVDADKESYLIDQDQVSACVTPRTRAIIVVHLYGKPTPMSALIAEATRRGILVIEDAAQAHGAMIEGRFVGSFGVAGCFSFHPSKNLAAAGDGGCITMDDAMLAEQIEAYRTHGQLVQHEHTVIGFNSKLDALQALVLEEKLPSLLQWNESRRALARAYREELRDLPVGFQRWDENELHAYHLFVMRTTRRDALLEYLQQNGIDAVVRYPVPIHLQPAFAGFGWKPGAFPIAEALARELLCLPLRPDLQPEERRYVVEHVRDFLSQ